MKLDEKIDRTQKRPGRWRAITVLGMVGLAACGTVPQTGTGQSAHLSTAAGAAQVCSGKTRTYYIAADEVQWDYAPSGKNLITGDPFDEVANVFVEPGPDRVGSVYLKSQYREYTNASFNTLKERPAKWEHLGLLGPAIEAEVGDTIKVVFKNKTRFPATVHPHGVFYTKKGEGAPYADGTSGADKADDAVATGDTFTYVWKVPERAGPGPMEGSSTMWMYHSHVDETADTNAGLMGPMVVTRCGSARPDGSPIDVDRQLVVNYSVMDENSSLWLDANVATLASPPLPDDEDFAESNLMHSINGYVYGNLPGLTMRKGERVRWYVMAMGTEVDLHTPHWHGNTVVTGGMRADVVSVLPAEMLTADMQPDNAGTWLFHCHVNDHIVAGMLSLFTVTP
jgi:FtsP/CotA-like multicopper oxidase with cupredoxin domain